MKRYQSRVAGLLVAALFLNTIPSEVSDKPIIHASAELEIPAIQTQALQPYLQWVRHVLGNPRTLSRSHPANLPRISVPLRPVTIFKIMAVFAAGTWLDLHALTLPEWHHWQASITGMRWAGHWIWRGWHVAQILIGLPTATFMGGLWQRAWRYSASDENLIRSPLSQVFEKILGRSNFLWTLGILANVGAISTFVGLYSLGVHPITAFLVLDGTLLATFTLRQRFLRFLSGPDSLTSDMETAPKAGRPLGRWAQKILGEDEWKPMPTFKTVDELAQRTRHQLQEWIGLAEKVSPGIAATYEKRNRAWKMKWIVKAARLKIFEYGVAGKSLAYQAMILAQLHSRLDATLQAFPNSDEALILEGLWSAVEHLPQMTEVVGPEGGLLPYAFAQQFGQTTQWVEHLRQTFPATPIEVFYQAQDFGLAKLRLRMPRSTVDTVMRIIEQNHPADLWETPEIQIHDRTTADIVWSRCVTDGITPDPALTWSPKRAFLILDRVVLRRLYRPLAFVFQLSPVIAARKLLVQTLESAGKILARSAEKNPILATAIVFAGIAYFHFSSVAMSLGVAAMTPWTLQRLLQLLKARIPHIDERVVEEKKVNRIFHVPAPGQVAHPDSPDADVLSEPWTYDAIDPETGIEVRYVDTLIISDAHLKDPDTRVHYVIDLLEHYRFRRLIILGDLFDYEVDTPMTPRQRELMRMLTRLRRSGVEIAFIPGNHDERWRDRVGKGMTVGWNWDVYQTVYDHTLQETQNAATARQEARRQARIRIKVQLYDHGLVPVGPGEVDGNLMEHGDARDGLTRDGKKLQHIGSSAYHQLNELDRWLDHERQKQGIISDFYFSVFGKRYVKGFLRRFRNRVVSAARRNLSALPVPPGTTVRWQVAMAGHIHDMVMRWVKGVLYINTGDSQNPMYANAIALRVDPKTGKMTYEAVHWMTTQPPLHSVPSPWGLPNAEGKLHRAA